MLKRFAILALLLLAASSALAQADLRLSAEKLDHPIYAREYMSFELTVHNDGPATATDIVVAIDFPPEVTFDRFLGPFGEQCNTSGRPVLCDFGSTLGSRASLYMQVLTVAPAAAGTFPLTVTVTHSGADPTPANNSLTAQFTTTLATAMYASIDTSRVRVDPGAVVATRMAVRSNLNLVDPGNILLHIEVVNSTLEIQPPSGWTCTMTATGNGAVCALPPLSEDCLCSQEATIVQRLSADRAGGEARLVMRITSDLPNLITETFPKIIQATRWLGVTTTADSGAGSLRQAIIDANGGCGDLPCKIVFEIPPPVPAEGWFTIIPATPLPHITARRVVVDGSHQATVSGDTNPLGPEVAIDGRLAGEGLAILSPCEAAVRGLAIGNFMANYGLWYGLDGANRPANCGWDWYLLDQAIVTKNHIGTDPTGTVAWPNLRGLRLDNGLGSVIDNVISGNRYSGIWMWRGAMKIINNRIGTTADGRSPLPNGASGILLGPQVTHGEITNNVIAYHPEMGVAIVRGATELEIRENSMRDNGGLPIDWALDGPDDPLNPASPEVAAPTLLSAVYDATRNETVVTGAMAPNLRRYMLIDLYANDHADGDGERWIGTTSPFVGGFTARIAGDFRGKWLNGTSIRFIQVFGKRGKPAGNAIFGMDELTSEFGNSVKVE